MEPDDCPVCLYSLRGLPPVEVPECGNEYGPDDVVLLGTTSAARLRVRKTDSATIAILGAIGAVAAVTGAVFHSYLGWEVAGGGVAMVLAALMKGETWRERRTAFVVYCSPHGFGQGPAKRGVRHLAPWEKKLEIGLQFSQKILPSLVIKKGLRDAVVLFVDRDWEGMQELQSKLQKIQPSRVFLERTFD